MKEKKNAKNEVVKEEVKEESKEESKEVQADTDKKEKDKKTEEKVENKTDDSLVGAIVAVVLMTIMLVAVVIIKGKYAFDFSKQNINDVIAEHGEPKEGEIVQIEVDTALAMYAQNDFLNGDSSVGQRKHYVVWLNETEFISLTVNGKKNIKKMDKLVEQSNAAYVDGTSSEIPEAITFKGEILSMDGDMAEQYQTSLLEYGISETWGYKIYYVTVDTTNPQWISILWVVLCGIVEGIAVYSLVKTIKRRKKREQVEA